MTIFRAIALAILLLVPSSTPLLAHQTDGRSLGMVLTTAQNGDSEYTAMLAHAAGVTRAPITYAWGALEPEPGEYDDGNLALAALFFPAMGMSIDVAITPVAGSRLVMPDDLAGRSFDDPEVIKRYLDLIEHVMAVLSEADVRLLIVGVEVDKYLGDDVTAWDAFAAFTAAVATYVHSIRPGIEVGVQSSTDSRILDPDRWSNIDQVSDIIATSYFPMDDLQVRDPSSITDDFDTLAALYPDRVIRIVEAGYPSSAANGSSDKRQAQFIHALFAAWDDHAGQILSITLSMQHDYGPAHVDAICAFYGDTSEAFAAFIGSIGFRWWKGDGAPKPAWEALMQETAARGWQP
ncbi:MAG: hypothetical protein R2848_07795 [Thermomicrobiales bacterium]